ncbi:MAG TPA: alpha/beta hydrolase [Burkholderiaceae bacterium]|nr:alpha/beta hydrolase [Burkholderiaceae bacterium]
MSVELVALHGLNNSPEVWSGVADTMRTADLRWHRPLLPALDRVESIAAHLLDALPGRFSLAGFSFGGYVALAMLEAAPDRIDRFVLVCSASRADPEAAREHRRKAIASLEVGGVDAHRALVAAQAPLTMHPSRVGDPALLAIRDRMVATYGPQRLVAHLRASIERPDRTGVLAGWPGPRHLVAAADDRVVTAALMAGVAADAPGATMTTVPDSGHLLPIERPAALAAALDAWLADG